MKIRQNTIAKRIISLEVLINSLFLVVILSAFVFFYLYSNNETKINSANYQKQMVVNSISGVIDKVKKDAEGLSKDQDIIDYIEYINDGNTPIVADYSDPDYPIYSNFILKTKSVKEYEPQGIYNIIYIATPTDCTGGTDGCAISQNGDLSGTDWLLTSRPWYVQLDDNDSILTTPYIDNLTGGYTISYIQKVYDGDALIGYVGIDMTMDALTSYLESIESSFTQTKDELGIFLNINLVNPQLIYISNDYNTQYFMKDYSDYADLDSQNNLAGDGFKFLVDNYRPDETIPLQIFNHEYLVSFSQIDSTPWSVVILYDNTNLINVQTLSLLVIGAIMLLVIIVSLILSKSIGRTLAPINNIVDTIEQIKNGNYDVNVEISENNEIKHIGDAINIMSKEIKKQMDLVYQNYAYDSLTGLKNRNASREEIDRHILIGNSKVAVCLMQVDNLKNINVTKGQIIGDNFIRAIANELRNIVRTKDMLFSNGGDEFIFVIDNFTTLDVVEDELNRILIRFKDPLVVNNIKIEVKFFVGVSVYPNDGNVLDELIKKCDMAIFNAKETTQKQINFYNEKIAHEVTYKAQVSEQLSHAIEKNQLYLKYQPLINKDNKFYGFESLVRWHSPSLGELSPEIFISNAEESYMIIPIGKWILRESCKAQVRLRNEFNREFMMSVNVSPIQLAQKDFIKDVKQIIKETDINPRYLSLEITETVFLQTSIVLEDKISELHKIGIKVSLDDFGTGYASLTNLRQVAFDNVKIDKTFVDGIFGNEKEHRIIGTLVSLVHSIGMNVIAEGIETKKQYEYLKQIDTDVFQGYIFSKPLEFEELEKYIEEFHKIPKSKRPDVYAKKND